MQSIKEQGFKFNSSLTAEQAKESESKGTIHFTTDDRIVLNGIDFTGVRKVEAGTTNGTVKVDGTEVSVYGLGSAAYTDASIYATADNVVPNTTTVNGHALSSNVTVTKSDIELGNVTNDAQVKRSEMGVINGVATLDANGLVPSSQLPSYVDDVIEAESSAALPETGEEGKIYVTKDDNKTYRWSGTQYTEISASLAIGTTTGTAYDGASGKALQDKLANIEEGATNVTDSTVSAWGYIKGVAYDDLTTKPTSAQIQALVGNYVSTFGGKTGAITVRNSLTDNGSVNLNMSDNELQASIVGLGDMAYKSTLTTDDIPALDASKITSGTFADDKIVSADAWNQAAENASIAIAACTALIWD